MKNGIAGIDHIIIGVRDLESARIGWTRLGFTLTPRGRHIGQGTANYCIMFARDYLELLGFVERDPYGHRLETFLARREGALGPAFALADTPEAVAGALTRSGLHPTAPRALGRQLELPEGTVVPRFSLINLPPEETPALDTFLCGHLTPELVRRPEWLVHANGVIGLAGIHVLVGDVASLVPAYERLFEIEAAGAAELSVRAGRHHLAFKTPAAFAEAHPGLAPDPGFPLPGVVALDLTVADREATADYLTQWQVVFNELPGGRLAVPPKEANGTVLFLSEG